MRLRHELQQQKEEDKKAAMSQLLRMKEEEMAAMKKGWENKVQELLSQVIIEQSTRVNESSNNGTCCSCHYG